MTAQPTEGAYWEKHAWAHEGTAEDATGPQSALVAALQVELGLLSPPFEVGELVGGGWEVDPLPPPEQSPPPGAAVAQAQTELAPAMTLGS